MEFSIYKNKLILSNNVFAELFVRGLTLVGLMSVFRGVLIFFMWSGGFKEELFGLANLCDVLFMGLRFDLVVMGFVFVPVAIVHPLLNQGWRPFLQSYLIGLWMIITLFYIIGSFTLINTGAFVRHNRVWVLRVILNQSIVYSILFWLTTLIGGLGIVLIFKKQRGFDLQRWNLHWSLRLLWPLLIVALMARGKLGAHHLRQDDAFHFKHPPLIDLVENPVWAFFN